MTGRLDKIISACAIISRREADGKLKAGAVCVDGALCRDGAMKCDSDKQLITLDGQRMQGDGFVYIILNKPEGVLSATEDKRGERTALDLLPEKYQSLGLGVVGRLDKDATGLLLLTNNGQLNHKLTSPKSGVDKVYFATVDTELREEDAESFAKGIELSDFACKPARLEIAEDRKSAFVTISEGKFHQVKRMLGFCGATVLTLKRLRIGSLELPADLAEGDFRHMTPDEILRLMGYSGMM